ncbi:MAG: choice-of-anchor B family protein [Ignavibacteria bacterium]
MKKIFFFIIYVLFFSITSQNSFPQAGKNMRLINNVDPLNKQIYNLNSELTEYLAIWGYTAPNGREYAILGSSAGTYFIDITDSSTTRVVDFVPGRSQEMKTFSHYCYTVTDGSLAGIQIIDLQYLPDSARYVKTISPQNIIGVHTISQDGPYIYLNGGFYSGTKVLDLSVDPENPIPRGGWQTSYVHDSRIRNDTIWACNINEGKISIIDARNKDSLKTIRQWTNGLNPVPHNCAIKSDRSYLYVTDEGYAGKVKIWDIRDLENITFINIYNPPLFEKCVSHNVELYDNLLVGAYYEGGVKLFDVSNPAVMSEIGWYDTYPEDNDRYFNGCWGVYRFASGKIIASDIQRGLFVLKYNPPVNATPKADFMTAKLRINNGDSLQFYDCATNNPTGYSWKLTGPQTYTSNQANPKFRFLSPGFYTAKLVVSNQFGADSLEKKNCIEVGNSIVGPFNFAGPLFQTIITNPGDTSKVRFIWSKSSNGPEITYKFRLIKSGSVIQRYFSSDNGGSDTIITFRKSYLDSLARQLGLSGDSIRTICRVSASNGIDSVISTDFLSLTIKTTTVGIINTSGIVALEFKLYYNYPNPFNPETIIKFDVPYFVNNKNSKTTIRIFDVTGREVQVLVSEFLTPGKYEVKFNGGSYASGVYYYSLESDDFIETKKMILIK